MTLILKLDLDMVKMYMHTKNEVSMSRGSKVIARTDRNTDRQTDGQTHLGKYVFFTPKNWRTSVFFFVELMITLL